MYYVLHLSISPLSLSLRDRRDIVQFNFRLFRGSVISRAALPMPNMKSNNEICINKFVEFPKVAQICVRNFANFIPKMNFI